MRTRITISVAVFALMIAGLVYAGAETFAQETQGTTQAIIMPELGRHPFARRIMARISRELGLTDAQKAEIKGIIEAERPAVEPLVRELAATRQQLRAATRDGHFDEAQVRALADQQAKTISSLLVEKERVKAKIYNVLTTEQRAKAEQMRERFESRVRERVQERMEKAGN